MLYGHCNVSGHWGLSMSLSSAAEQPQDPRLWRNWASTPRAKSTGPSFLSGGFLQCWSDTNAAMNQPVLDHHIIVFHQGGAKRVQRDGGAGRRIVDVELNSTTTVEAGSSYRWRTEGPIAFSHLYVRPDHFAMLIAETFDRDPASVGFAETIGRPDPHIAGLFDLLLAGRDKPDWSMTADYYLDALLVRLASTSGWGGEFRKLRRLSLTHHTVSKVREFIRSNISERITLDDLAELTGYSRFHFVRAFRETTGLPPYAFLLNERIRAAQSALESSDEPISQIARVTGFGTHAHFSARFRELTGMTPVEYRRHSRGERASDGDLN